MKRDDYPENAQRRRDVLGLLGGVGAALIAGRSLAAVSCTPRPEQEEGPFFSDRNLQRPDIRTDAGGAARAGIPLELTVNVGREAGSSCAPLTGARVDIWHCDAAGAYSDFQPEGTAGRTFLRGYQVTDGGGTARFTTIYPGWYRGRAVHIHLKVRSAAPGGRMAEFTSQIYFDDRLTDEIHALPPYAARGQRSVRNTQDGLFRGGGQSLVLEVARSGAGYAGTFDLGLRPS
jgi:protocatechuate 3,4-dioxygenase beta subunit